MHYVRYLWAHVLYENMAHYKCIIIIVNNNNNIKYAF